MSVIAVLNSKLLQDRMLIAFFLWRTELSYSESAPRYTSWRAFENGVLRLGLAKSKMKACPKNMCTV